MRQKLRRGLGAERIPVSFEQEVQEIIDKELIPRLGKRRPEVIRNIVRIYLAERGYLRLKGAKSK